MKHIKWFAPVLMFAAGVAGVVLVVGQAELDSKHTAYVVGWGMFFTAVAASFLAGFIWHADTYED